MAGVTRTVHPTSTFHFGSIDKFAPDLRIRGEAVNGSESAVPQALCFVDPDGETHVFLFSDEGRRKLVGALTGGIMVVPGERG